MIHCHLLLVSRGYRFRLFNRLERYDEALRCYEEALRSQEKAREA